MDLLTSKINYPDQNRRGFLLRAKKVIKVKLKYLYVTKTRGIGGKLENPEDFIVKETIDSKFFSKYSRQNRVKLAEGKNSLIIVKKRSMTTHQAVKVIAEKYGIDKKEISYAGLKDKFAVTEQYMTIKQNVEGFKENNIEVRVVGKTDKVLGIGDLIENQFEITLHNCKNLKNMPIILKKIRIKGIPNYFGPQRFSTNNHIIGKLLVKRKFSYALELINKNYTKKYNNIVNVDKKKLKFFINAYQSYIFNESLNDIIKTKRKIREISIIGSDTKKIHTFMKRILDKEGISSKNFEIKELNLSCRGGNRRTFINPDIKYKIKGKDVTFYFSLPKGSYATVVLNEISKKEFRKQ